MSLEKIKGIVFGVVVITSNIVTFFFYLNTESDSCLLCFSSGLDNWIYQLHSKIFLEKIFQDLPSIH